MEGSPVERHRDSTLQNYGNCPGGVKLKDAFSLDGSGISLHPALTAAQREQVIDSLESLYEQPVGRELLDSIRTSAGATGNTVMIQVTNSGNLCSMANPAQAYAGGTGSCSTVSYNPNNNVGRPAEVGLGHELIHAHHAQNGVLATGNSIPAISTQPQGNAELQAIGIGPYSDDRLTDNQLRNERGLPNRHSHAVPDTNDFPYNPSSGNRAGQVWSTGSGGEKLVYADK